VREGEVVLLSGGNGAGKTTLLRLIAGLVPLFSGSAEVLGHDLSRDRRSHRRLVALVGHETFCYDELTVRENLRFAARSVGAHDDAVDAAITQLTLEPVADVLHARLSAGQRRRLALAAAITRNPRLVLLDEPHAGLDAEARAVVDDLIGGAAAAGCTVVVASHELERVRALAAREVVLTGGQAHGEFASRNDSTEVARSATPA
jgi:heme ABC exporter ATP-binding subunit CcmA